MEPVFGGHIIAPPQPEVSARRLQQALAAATCRALVLPDGGRYIAGADRDFPPSFPERWLSG